MKATNNPESENRGANDGGSDRRNHGDACWSDHSPQKIGPLGQFIAQLQQRELDDGRGSDGVKLPEYILDLAREVSDRLLDGGFDFFVFLINAVVYAAKPDAPRTASTTPLEIV
jgi:hypothetical protein